MTTEHRIQTQASNKELVSQASVRKATAAEKWALGKKKKTAFQGSWQVFQ